MFTGIIHHLGVIQHISQLKSGIQLAIQTQFTELSLGESIAVDGTCLTVTNFTDAVFYVELSKETLNVTIANRYQIGQTVNLERAMMAGDRFGGHFVTGHVDATTTLLNIQHHGDFSNYTIGPFNQEQQNYLITKGSITLNGVSLTINQLENNNCQLMLIPHTLTHTTLATLTIGDIVNIEFDMLAKLIAKQTQGVLHV